MGNSWAGNGGLEPEGTQWLGGNAVAVHAFKTKCYQRFPLYFLLWIFFTRTYPTFPPVLGEWLRAEELSEGNNQQRNRNPHCVAMAGRGSTFCSGSRAARGIIRVRAQTAPAARGAEEGITLRKQHTLQQGRNKERNGLLWCCFVMISSENPPGVPLLSSAPLLFFLTQVLLSKV